MAIDATEIFARHAASYRLGLEDTHVMCSRPRLVRTADESRALVRRDAPCFIPSASGMLAAGACSTA